MSSLLERPFVRVALLCGILHFVLLGLLAGLLFLLSHIPPRAANLDPLILFFQWIYDILYLPIATVRWLWPGESSPWLLNIMARIGGSAMVGLAGAGVAARRRN